MAGFDRPVDGAGGEGTGRYAVTTVTAVMAADDGRGQWLPKRKTSWPASYLSSTTAAILAPVRCAAVSSRTDSAAPVRQRPPLQRDRLLVSCMFLSFRNRRDRAFLSPRPRYDSPSLMRIKNNYRRQKRPYSSTPMSKNTNSNISHNI